MSLSHCFSVSHAEKYGLEEAIFMNQILKCIQNKMVNIINLIEYETLEEMERKKINSIFPYWEQDKIKDVIKKLIEKGCFNP